MDKQLLSMLVCPECKGALKYEAAAQELLCTFDGLAFPIRDGVPVMLVNDARRLSEDEKLDRAEKKSKTAATKEE